MLFTLMDQSVIPFVVTGPSVATMMASPLRKCCKHRKMLGIGEKMKGKGKSKEG
jgi:hypothetical protein